MKLRYYGHFGLRTGYGKAALEYALALRRHTDIDLDLRPLNSFGTYDDPRMSELDGLLGAGGDADVVLVHTLPRDCAKVLEQETGRYRAAIAYTTWEAQKVPDEVELALSGRRFAQLWTPSRASASAFDMGDTEDPKVVVVPHTFDPHLARQPDLFTRNRNTLPYQFLYVGAWNRRKNVDGLIRAFAHAFDWWRPGRAMGLGHNAHDRPPHLHLHCPGASVVQFRMAMESTGLEHLPVSFSNEPMDEATMLQAYDGADCYVTASRGEAWGLPAFEAMLAGRHIIYPVGQGMDMFLEDTSAWSVRAYGTPASLDTQAEVIGNAVKVTVSGPTGLTSEVLWWEPDLLDLSSAMLEAYRQNLSTTSIHYELEETFGHAAIAQRIKKNLEDLAL